MRVIRYAGAALAFALGAANAQETDCAALHRPNPSFQITYVIRSGHPAQPNGLRVNQYWHGERGVSRLVRRGEAELVFAEIRNGFVTRWRGMRNGRSFEIEHTLEGLDPDINHFTVPRDFAYQARRRHSSGSEVSLSSRVRFRGEETVTVGDCPFRVLVWDMEERELNPPRERMTRIWYAPQLRTYLRQEIRASEQADVAQESVATRIDTRFQPFDMH